MKLTAHQRRVLKGESGPAAKEALALALRMGRDR